MKIYPGSHVTFIDKQDTEQLEENTDYWKRADDLGKTPLIKHPKTKDGLLDRFEKRVFGHVCYILPLFTRIGFILICVFNFADTITDIMTTVDMFRNRKYGLGVISVGFLLSWGYLSHSWALSFRKPNINSWFSTIMNYLQVLCFLKFPVRVFKTLVRHNVLKRRTDGHDYGVKGEGCRTYRCADIYHKLIRTYYAIIEEKMLFINVKKCLKVDRFLLFLLK